MYWPGSGDQRITSNFFATQLVNHLLDPGATGANAGSHGINFALHRVHGHLGARAYRAGRGIGFPGHGDDPNRTLLNLGNLIFE